MTLEKKLCAVCAWRRNCKKKFSSSSSGTGVLYCTDFTKDLSIKDEPIDEVESAATEDLQEKKKDKYWKW